MTCDRPTREQIPQLLTLWKEIFGAYNGFWELFLETGFSLDRCRCITEQGQITAALTWLDCTCRGQKLAYLYAVMTHPDHRGQGLCAQLMEDTHRLLRANGYAAAILVPAGESLRAMYENMGYRTCTHISEFTAEAGGPPPALRAVGPTEFAALRREFLPPFSVIQEGENLLFLARQAQFYAGDAFLMAARQEDDSLTAMEFLGDPAAAPGILTALGSKKGTFRRPGGEHPFAMFCPLREDAIIPQYFGFAFD